MPTQFDISLLACVPDPSFVLLTMLMTKYRARNQLMTCVVTSAENIRTENLTPKFQGLKIEDMNNPLIHSHTVVWALLSHLVHGCLPRNPWDEQKTCIISPRFQSSLPPQSSRTRWMRHDCETKAMCFDKTIFCTVWNSLFKVVVADVFQNHDCSLS